MTRRHRSRHTCLGFPRLVPGLLLLIVAPLVVAGCGTGGLAVKRDVWEAQDDFERRQAGLSEKVLSIDGRLTAVEEEIASLRYSIEQMTGRIESSDTELSRGLEAVRDGQQQLGIELEGRIRNVDSGRQQDREDLLARMQIVLDEVMRENERLSAEIADIRSSMSVGYTHVVQRGETLAKIAAQYGVTVQDIVAANDIANPNVIAVGKSLFIPQK